MSYNLSDHMINPLKMTLILAACLAVPYQPHLTPYQLLYLLHGTRLRTIIPQPTSTQKRGLEDVLSLVIWGGVGSLSLSPGIMTLNDNLYFFSLNFLDFLFFFLTSSKCLLHGTLGSRQHLAFFWVIFNLEIYERWLTHVLAGGARLLWVTAS